METKDLARLREALDDAIEALIALADAIDCDAEAEEIPLEDGFVSHDPSWESWEPGGRDVSWVEWDALPEALRGLPPPPVAVHEDDEVAA